MELEIFTTPESINRLRALMRISTVVDCLRDGHMAFVVVNDSSTSRIRNQML